MAEKVVKFGGTSMADAAAIEQIKAAGQIVLYISQENPEMIGFGFNAYFDDIAVVNK